MLARLLILSGFSSLFVVLSPNPIPTEDVDLYEGPFFKKGFIIPQIAGYGMFYQTVLRD